MSRFKMIYLILTVFICLLFYKVHFLGFEHSKYVFSLKTLKEKTAQIKLLEFQINQNKKTKQEISSSMDKLSSQLHDAKEISTQLEEKQNDFDEFKKKLSQFNLHIPSLLIELERLAKSNHVLLTLDFKELSNVTPKQGPTDSGNAQDFTKKELALTLSVSGKYNDIEKYISDLEESPFITVLKTDLTITDKTAKGDIYISVFYLGSSQ